MRRVRLDQKTYYQISALPAYITTLSLSVQYPLSSQASPEATEATEAREPPTMDMQVSSGYLYTLRHTTHAQYRQQGRQR